MKLTTSFALALSLFAGSSLVANAASMKTTTTAAPAATETTTTTTAPAGAMMSTKTKMTGKVRSQKSHECSTQADVKKLHGKERAKFRMECMKTA